MHDITFAINSFFIQFHTELRLGSSLQTFRKLQEPVELCDGLRTSDQMLADLVGGEWVAVFVFLEEEEGFRQ